MREVKKWKWIENIVSVDLPMANESKVNAQKLTSVPAQKFYVAFLHFLHFFHLYRFFMTNVGHSADNQLTWFFWWISCLYKLFRFFFAHILIYVLFSLVWLERTLNRFRHVLIYNAIFSVKLLIRICSWIWTFETLRHVSAFWSIWSICRNKGPCNVKFLLEIIGFVRQIIMNDFGRILGPINPNVNLLTLSTQSLKCTYAYGPFESALRLGYFSLFSNYFLLKLLLDMVLSIKSSGYL